MLTRVGWAVWNRSWEQDCCPYNSAQTDSDHKSNDQSFSQISGAQMNTSGKGRPVEDEAPVEATLTWIELVVLRRLQAGRGAGEGRGPDVYLTKTTTARHLCWQTQCQPESSRLSTPAARADCGQHTEAHSREGDANVSYYVISSALVMDRHSDE